MKERAPALIAIVLLLSLVMGTWWAADYAQRAILVDPPRRITHEPDSWASDFVMVRTDIAGVAINRLEGRHMQHYPDNDSYEITKPKAIGQQPNSPITIGTSDKAIMDQNGSRVVMSGNARVHRVPDQDRPALDVTSEQLTVMPDDNVVFTDMPALVVNGNSTMNGKGMRYDNNTRQLQVFSATDVKISGQDSKPGKSAKPDKTEKKP
ncbi:LPS export ABC transporter periplasmic protein LptC [Pollutimonas bauzanensis]|uniref:Lipopolysaccharide export system protein LptC n=1 Tax=Pollutimonas bauzanensis TaxID=658167 RepID=A0A1M5RBD7_9BURK|nr:LPS export ABC transporter periplasmic protein LptC [Pollutimonas bauzanensis]SHH23615.1 lipopolysaccharide export system protein LptC [Pollutimonas bauzanensis]